MNIKKIIFYLTNRISDLLQQTLKQGLKVEGVHKNLLASHVLVVGLSGTGDNLKNTVFTKTGLTDLLERLGVNVQGADIITKNIAAVTVTASLPPFARLGTKIDVKVGALGDAKSLKGGTLLGADGNVYAVAQGAIALAKFTSNSGDVKTKSIGVETNGYIQSGAIVENEIDLSLGDLQTIKFSLYLPDFAMAIAVSGVINDNVSGNTAKALDAATIEVAVPSYRQSDIVEFIAKIEGSEVKPDYIAKIVINESTGAVVIGDKVNIRLVAIEQGSLIVNAGHPELIDKKYDPETNEKTRDSVSAL